MCILCFPNTFSFFSFSFCILHFQWLVYGLSIISLLLLRFHRRDDNIHFHFSMCLSFHTQMLSYSKNIYSPSISNRIVIIDQMKSSFFFNPIRTLKYYYHIPFHFCFVFAEWKKKPWQFWWFDVLNPTKMEYFINFAGNLFLVSVDNICFHTCFVNHINCLPLIP